MRSWNDRTAALDELVKFFRKICQKLLIILKIHKKDIILIWVKSINKIIEVLYEKELIKNKDKALSTKNFGYDFEFWIYSREKKKLYKTPTSFYL